MLGNNMIKYILLGLICFAPFSGIAEDRYVVTLEIGQGHFTLDIWQHVKDAYNKITIDIPVDKEFYDSVKEGDFLNNDFRMASFLIHGSIGNWKVRIKDKNIITNNKEEIKAGGATNGGAISR
jgi:hypothetical protein